MARVVTLLAGGQFTSDTYATEQEASEVIRAWAEGVKKRIEDCTCSTPDTRILVHTTADGVVRSAKLAQHIIGMYIPVDTPSAQDRMAGAFEKMIKFESAGDEWKGEE